MNLYIDTNILLTFYHLSKDDLDELKKLALLIESKKLNLFIPVQTKNEFHRNRDKTINEAINSIKEQKLPSRYPQISKGYEEYDLLEGAYKDFEKYKNKIIQKIESDAKDFKLNADLLIQRIFNSSTLINISTELLEKAKTRFDLGNPPGKGRSYGDALNWETLLECVNCNEDLCLISDDSDYTSLLDKRHLNQFLKKEWIDLKNSNIHFFKTLSDFFKDKFPEISLSDELEKDLLIESLAEAGTFASAKSRLAKLSTYTEFNNKQLNDIIEIAINNNQLYWIAIDQGVGDVLKKIILGKEDILTPELLQNFRLIYDTESIVYDTDHPF